MLGTLGVMWAKYPDVIIGAVALALIWLVCTVVLIVYAVEAAAAKLYTLKNRNIYRQKKWE